MLGRCGRQWLPWFFPTQFRLVALAPYLKGFLLNFVLAKGWKNNQQDVHDQAMEIPQKNRHIRPCPILKWNLLQRFVGGFAPVQKTKTSGCSKVVCWRPKKEICLASICSRLLVEVNKHSSNGDLSWQDKSNKNNYLQQIQEWFF